MNWSPKHFVIMHMTSWHFVICWFIIKKKRYKHVSLFYLSYLIFSLSLPHSFLFSEKHSLHYSAHNFLQLNPSHDLTSHIACHLLRVMGSWGNPHTHIYYYFNRIFLFFFLKKSNKIKDITYWNFLTFQCHI